jgi:hypothetical protein
MSPAGSGSWAFRPTEWTPYLRAYLLAALVVGGIVCIVVLTSGGAAPPRAAVPARAPSDGAWSQFCTWPCAPSGY